MRKSLTALENLFYACAGGEIEKEIAASLIQRSGMRFDVSGDEHYDLLSAFQKSIRGSDENAAVFYLAKLLEYLRDESIDFLSGFTSSCWDYFSCW